MPASAVVCADRRQPRSVILRRIARDARAGEHPANEDIDMSLQVEAGPASEHEIVLMIAWKVRASATGIPNRAVVGRVRHPDRFG